MLNFTHKKALAVAGIMLSILSTAGYAACGDGVLDSGEECDMGTLNGINQNKGPADQLSGCTTACKKATATDGTWDCSNSSATYNTKISTLSTLFLKLAYWNGGKNAPVGTANPTTLTTSLPNTVSGATDLATNCAYYKNGNPLDPVIRATWTATTTNGCIQYQKDMVQFMSLNYNTPVSQADCDLVKGVTAAAKTAGLTLVNGRVELVNPIPLDTTINVPAKFNPTAHSYIVNGC